MTKRGGFAVLYLLIFAIFSLFILSLISSAIVRADYENNITQAYTWLENRTVDKGWPRSLTTEQFAFSILALKDPAAIVNLTKKSYLGKGECWSMLPCSAKETALAKLALNSLGNSTEKADAWLLNATKAYVPSAGTWQLEILSEPPHDLRCVIVYDNKEHKVNVTKEELIGDPGNCFTKPEKYWLQLSSSCLNKSFEIKCNDSFSATFLLKYSAKWYVINDLEDSSSVADFENLTISVTNTSCIANQAGCDYEGTAWAAYAFARAGQDEAVESLIPYLVIEKENYKKFMPEAFLAGLGLGSDELKAKQRADGLWTATNTAYNELYDTALVGIMTLRSEESGNWTRADKALFSRQKKAGNWVNASGSVSDAVGTRETAMILYALQIAPGEISDCVKQGYECVSNCTAPGIKQTVACNTGECCLYDYGDQECKARDGECKATCAEGESVADYDCPTGTGKCCSPNGLLTCTQLNGTKCTSTQKCVKDGFVVPSVTAGDGECCPGQCVTPSKNCSELSGVICKTSEGKSCEDKWLPSTDDECCTASACKLGVKSCAEIGGALCDGECEGGLLVVAQDTASKKTCCIQGTCVVQSCADAGGTSCESGETCSGDLIKALDADECCVGTCAKECSAAGGEKCIPPNTCSQNLTAGGRFCCKKDKCVEKTERKFSTVWLFIIILIALALVIIMLLRKKKKKKPAVLAPGMLPPGMAGRPMRPGVFGRGAPVPRAPMPAGKSFRPMPQTKQVFPLKQMAKPVTRPAAVKPISKGPAPLRQPIKPAKPAAKKPVEKKSAVFGELENLGKE
jgi:hypothetical protein